MIMSKPFEFGGLHHLALVCKDMQRTVDFYTNILGMNLNKGFDLDGGYGQHFFFDMGDGQELAFFWFNDAHSAQPGVASAANLVASGNGTISSAHGSMNHLAFSVSKDKIDGYRQELVSRGVDCSEVVNHDGLDFVGMSCYILRAIAEEIVVNAHGGDFSLISRLFTAPVLNFAARGCDTNRAPIPVRKVRKVVFIHFLLRRFVR